MNKPFFLFSLFCCFLTINLIFIACDDKELINDTDIEIVKDTLINDDGLIEFPSENGSIDFPEENVSTETWETKKWHTSDFTGIDFINQEIGYICGANGTILKTIDRGKTYVNLKSGTHQFLYSIKFIDDLNGYVVGDNKTLLKTVDGGNTWHAIDVRFYEDFRTLYFLNKDIGFITGSNGIILRTSDGGKSWLRVYQGTYGNGIYGIYFIDNKNGFASGRGSSILKTTDAGLSWHVQSDLQNLGDQHILTAIYFTDENNGYVVGGIPTGYNGSSVLLKTSDGGKNWEHIPLTISNSYLTAIKFVNANVGYIVGGHVYNNTSTVLKTVNGGSTWIKEDLSSTRQYGLEITENNVFSVGMNGTILKK